MSNKLRGEVKVTVCGETHFLKPTMEAICEVEDAAGGETTLPLMLMAASKGAVSLKMMGWVIYGCIIANTKAARGDLGRCPTMEAIMLDVRKQGMSYFLLPVQRVIVQMATPEEAQEEAVKKEPGEVASA